MEGTLADPAGVVQVHQLLGGQRTAVLIVLGNGHEADGELVAVLEAHLLGGLPDAQAHVGDVHPGTVGLIVVGSLELLAAAGIDDVALAVQDVEQEAGGVADQGNGHVAQLGVGMQGGPVSGEGVLDAIGVANEVALVDALEHGQVVQTAGVGEDEVVVDVIGVVGTVIHAAVGPVAVEAQHGDGVLGLQQTLGIGSGGDVHKALDVGAADIALQSGLVGQLQLHLDMDLFAGLDGEEAGAQGGQDQVGIEGIDHAVAVEIGLGVKVSHGTGGVLQDDLGIGGIGQAVAVQVAGIGGADGDLLRAHGVGGHGGQVHGGVAVVGNSVDLIELLGEEITAQGVGLDGVGEVVDGEAEGVDAVLDRIVAQLSLDLAVGGTGIDAAIHQDVGAGGQSGGHIRQAGALLEDGVEAALFLVHQRLGGGHQQAVGQSPGAHAGLLGQVLLPDVLHDQGGHTSDLGSGHGGAGVVHVSIAGGDLTVDGVDIAAGGSDLGLQLQIARNAPGAEGAHGGLAADDRCGDLVGDIHGAHVDTLCVLNSGGSQEITVDLGHGNGRAGACVIGQVHADSALDIVVDDASGETGIGCVVGLLGEIDLTTGDRQDGLAGITDGSGCGCCILGRTDAVHQHVGAVHAADGVQTLGVRIVGNAAGVVQLLTGHLDVVVGGADVVHGGHGQGVGGGAGSADDGEVHVIAIQGGHAVAAVVSPGTGVAAGHSHHGVALGEAVQDVLIQAAPGKALVGAQGQVDHITAEHDGILDGDHVVGIEGTAILTEDLHDHQLGIGSHALGQDGVQGGDIAVTLGDEAVGGGDTGNMGAVAALAVIVVGHTVVAVHIVDGEGDLLVDIPGTGIGQVVVLDVGVDVQILQNILHIDHVQQIQALDVLVGGQALLGGLLLQRIAEGTGAEALVIGVQAGVDDGDAGAGTGVAGGPGIGSAEHAGGGGLEGLSSLSGGHGLILLLDHHIRNTHHGGDLIDGAVGHVGGDDVGSQGHVPDHIQLLPLQGPLLDGGGQLGLLLPQGLAVGLGGYVGCNALGGELLHGGLVLQDDGYTDSICLSVFLPLIGMLHRLKLQLDVCVNGAQLFYGELMAGLAAQQVRKAPGMSHGAHAEHHAQHEHHRQYSDHRVSLFHFRSSSSDHFVFSANTPVYRTKTSFII